MATTAVKKVEAGLPAEMMTDILADAGAGLDYGMEELTIPRLQLVQALSPELSKKQAKFIEGISAGDIFNSVTRHFWAGEEGVDVVPCYQVTRYNEWIPRDQGGGFVQELSADHPDVRAAVRQGSRETLPSGNELIKTDEHYCLVNNNGSWEPAIVGMSKTQLKVSRRWKTQIMLQKMPHPKEEGRSISLPLFGTIWKLYSVSETNKNNEEYYNWSVDHVGVVTNPALYTEAKALRESIARGDVKAAPEERQQGTASVAPVTSDSDDEIPF